MRYFGDMNAKQLTLAMIVLMVACVPEGAISQFHTENFSITPKCGKTDRTLEFTNPFSETLVIKGIAFTPGTNSAGHFTIQGIKIGKSDEVPPQTGGRLRNIEVPSGQVYKLRVRFNPQAESGTKTLTAQITVAFTSPTSGLLQVVVKGSSKGETDCPKIETGESVSLDGTVSLTITRLVASTNGLEVPIGSDNGIRPFKPVKLSGVKLSASGKSIVFPQLTATDAFILPPPACSKVPELCVIVETDTLITTEAAVTGTFDASTGAVTLPKMRIRMKDRDGEVRIIVTLTTASVIRGDVDVGRLRLAKFKIVGGKVVGSPINKKTGEIVLVGHASIKKPDGFATGSLNVANNFDLVIRIEATILCADGTTSCSAL